MGDTQRRRKEYRPERRRQQARPASYGWQSEAGATATAAPAATARSGGTMNGTVKRLVKDRGFGFIRGDQGQEWFFHRSSCQQGADYDSLREGQAVTFTEEPSPKGLRAGNVQLA